jgi:hypothetical protein
MILASDRYKGYLPECTSGTEIKVYELDLSTYAVKGSTAKGTYLQRFAGAFVNE